MTSANADVPQILLIVHGREFATQRVPIFLRTCLSSRSAPLNFHVLCDASGCAGFLEVWQLHVLGEDLTVPGDSLTIFEDDSALSGRSKSRSQSSSLEGEQHLPLPARAEDFLSRIHPSCKARGYGYLFLKLLAAEIVPTADRE